MCMLCPRVRLRGPVLYYGGPAPDGQNGGSVPLVKPPPPWPHGSWAGAFCCPALNPPFCWPYPPLWRTFLVTFAVARRRAGPTSSTSISKTVRLSPSRVSKERCFNRPCTITCEPLLRDSATFSAYWRHTVQARNIDSPSRHSPAWRSKVRGVEATRKLATASPLGVKRRSGSEVR